MTEFNRFLFLAQNFINWDQGKAGQWEADKVIGRFVKDT